MATTNSWFKQRHLSLSIVGKSDAPANDPQKTGASERYPLQDKLSQLNANPMKLIFLGTTGYHPNETRHTSCLMLPELGVIIDAGTGMFRARNHIETNELNIFLTHAHLDHTMGLTFIFDVIHGKEIEQVVVHGDETKLQTIQQHLFSPLLFPVKPPLAFRPFRSNVSMLSSDTKLTHFPLEHPGGSLGFRIDSPDGSFAYVTDTTASPDASYIEHIKGVDLLIHECYFPDGWEEHAALTGHSCTTPVAQVAKQAEVGRLVLVHVNPLDETTDPINLDVARAIFSNTEIAVDKQEIVLGE